MITYWSNMAPRERKLTAIVLLLLLVSGVFVLARKGYDDIDTLNRTIINLEDKYINLKHQDALSASISEQFKQVEAHHSSTWRSEEIHDRLRKEVYRLALTSPPTLEGQKRPIRATAKTSELVRIPSLRQGTLSKGDGFREYHLTIRIPFTPLANLLVYMQRLVESSQSLRIDGFQLRRPYQSKSVTAILNITRVVVDGTPDHQEDFMTMSYGNIIRNSSFELWYENRREFKSWVSNGCQFATDTEHVTEGSLSMKMTAVEDGASVYQVHEALPGVTCELTADISIDGPGTLGVALDKSGDMFVGAQELVADGETYTYRLLFTMPEQDAGMMDLRTPMIVIKNSGTTAYVDNVDVRRLIEWDDEE